MTAQEENKKNNFQFLKGAKIYQIFTDRFDGHKKKYTSEELRKNFLFGNLKAAMTKLDYIKSMGFNMIWLTPFYVNQPAGYHGYHVENYYHVDPRFVYGEKIEDNNVGNVFDPNDLNVETGADLFLKEFIQECHKKGLKVMMDCVVNHCYHTHLFFKDAQKNVESKYRNWFYFIKNDKGNKNHSEYKHLSFLGFGDLPKLNLDNPEVQEHLINSTNKFLKYGIDAIRIDHAMGPSPKGLNTIICKIHENYPNVPFLGEILPFDIDSNFFTTVFGTTEKKLEKLNVPTLESLKLLDEFFLEYKDVLDGVIDFSFHYYIDFFVNGKLNEEECIKELEEHFKRFENHSNFILIKNIDSHDCDRIMFRCKNNVLLFKKAMELLYRDYLGRKDPLIVYYGTEDFMTQEKTIKGEPYGDFRCRQPMYFGKDYLEKLFKEN